MEEPNLDYINIVTSESQEEHLQKTLPLTTQAIKFPNQDKDKKNHKTIKSLSLNNQMP